MATMMQRPSLDDLVKAAMEGAAEKANIAIAASRHNGTEQVKAASAAPSYTSNEYIQKLASALDYLAKQAEDGVGPGAGPNHLEVTKSDVHAPPVQPNSQGQAHHQPPKTVAAQGTQLETNVAMSHAEQPVDPMHNEKTSSLQEKNAAVMAKLAEYMKEAAGGKPAALPTDFSAMGMKGPAKPMFSLSNMGPPKPPPAKAVKTAEVKLGSAELLMRNLATLGVKTASEADETDANISQSTISNPPGADPAGVGVPSEPSDVNSQKSMISSNQAAIDYKKQQAKSDPKKDLGHVLTEPALTSSTDHTLQQAFAHTGDAGVKISSDKAHSLAKTAAAQALLTKLAAAVTPVVKKEKQSALPAPQLDTPQAQSGFNSANRG